MVRANHALSNSALFGEHKMQRVILIPESININLA